MSADRTSSQTDLLRDELCAALNVGDLDRATQLLQAGADINARDEYGDPLLKRVISDWGMIENRFEGSRFEVVRFMLDHGADPKLLNDEDSGPLFSAVIDRNEELLRLLLEAGADPNRERDYPESLYDYAKFNYRFDTYPETDGMELPEDSAEEDRANQDTWLEFLDRVAIKHGRPRPTLLRLLRQFGAKTTAELEGR